MKFPLKSVLYLFSILLAPGLAMAASGTWTAPVAGNWSDSTKWTSSIIADGAANTASFVSNGTTDYTVTLDSNRTLNALVKATNATTGQTANVTVSASPGVVLTIQNASGGTINNAYNGNSTFTVDANIVLNSDLGIRGTGNNNAKTTVGATAGTYSITGTANLNFNGTGTSAGAITVNNNINVVGNVSNISTSTGSGTITINGVIGTNVTGVVQNATGASGNSRITVLNGANTYTSATTVTAGTLRAGIASVANVSGAFGNNSAVTMSGGNLQLGTGSTYYDNQVGSLAGTGGTITLGTATLTTGGDNTSTSAAAVISGTGGLTKIGTGTQTLTGANTYTGATTVTQGTLALGATGSLASTSLIVAAGSTLATFDASAVSGGFGLAGRTFTANITDVTPAASYTLVNLTSHTGDFSSVSLTGNFVGSLSNGGSGDIWTGNIGGYDWTFSESLGTLTAVPEPSTYAVIAGLAALMGVAMQRRRSKVKVEVAC